MQVKSQNLITWIKGNKKEFWMLLGVLVLAAFFRLWRIDEYLTFLGDEGRDVRIVSRFVTDFDLMFIGPRTSIGNMYLGPLYYYLIAPFLALWRLSPTGPAVLVAILGTATVFLVWFVAREWFGKVAAFSSALLFAMSPVVISLSKTSWNPNIMPFFALLAIYSIWRVWRHHEWKWLLVVGASFGFILQSHYLGLLLLPTIILFWILTLRDLHSKVGNFLRHTMLGSVIFAILMSPLFIFDAKHGWRNFESMRIFFTERQTTVSIKPWNAIPDLWPLWQDQVVTRLVVAKSETWGLWAAIIILIGAICLGYGLYKDRDKFRLQSFALVSVWIFIGLVGLGLYKQHIYDHYFGFVFMAPFLLIGGILQKIWDTKFKLLVIIIVVGLLWINLQENPLKYPPNRQMQNVQQVNQKIIEESQGKPFNFALISKNNYEEGYLYFLEQRKAPVLAIDPQRYEETLADQLFVVCENPICEP
ncbi:hypothetical protein CMO96_03770, partial [Candidatus Woesebacteria bacterium]|nr:hypothetical protein [Candidatus Woesebacteria bacterium]